MASAEKYAAWIVANANKRGTPEFDTVAKAYQEAKALMVSRPVDSSVSDRRAELDAEERAAQEKLAQDTQMLEAYDQSAIGKFLAAPSRLFGGESFAEEQLAKRKADAAEVTKRINRERAFMEREGRTAPAPTLGEYVAAGLKAPARGAIEGTSQFLGTLGVTGEEGEQTARAAEERGTAFAKSLGLGASETAEFDPLMRNIEAFGGGLGSTIPYLGAELLGQRLKPLTKAAPYIARGAQAILGSGQGASQARQQMDDFEKETGQKIDPTTRKLVQAGGGAIGLTELLPVGRMLDSLPGPIKTAVNKRITDIVTQTGAGKLVPEAARTAIRETLQAVESRAVGRIATRGVAPEAAQEGGAQLAQNVLERAAYNPDQDVMENVAENAILGGLVGGTVRGGFEVTRALGKRAADNRQKAFDQTATPVEEFDINVPSTEDPTQLTRQRVQRLTDPDDDGNVFARRADGTVYQTSVNELYRMRVPTDGIRAVPIPETLAAPAVTQRLTAALGETSSDLDVSGFIKNVATTLNNGMALGNPESTEDYIQRQRNDLRRARISEEERIARMLVLDEAAKLNDEYMNLVTMPPEGAAPDAATAAPTSEAPVLSDEAIQAQVDSMREQAAQRAAALEEIAGDSNQIDKVSIFADRMAQSGLAAPTPVEVARLNDALRAESEAETAAGREETAQERRRVLDRANIIESVLYDDRISADTKVDRINAKMQGKGLGPLSRYELERIAGVEAANAVFGPEGEYQEQLDEDKAVQAEMDAERADKQAKNNQRRQALLDQVVADPTITDKYRGFAEALDQYPDLSGPTAEEIRALQDGTAEIESMIPGERVEAAPEVVPEPKIPTVFALPSDPTLSAFPVEAVEGPTPEVAEEPAPEVVEEPAPEVVEEPAPTDIFRTDLADYGSLVGRNAPVPEELVDAIADKVIDLVENNDTATLAELSADPELGPVIQRFFTNERAAITKRGVERAKAAQPAPTAATQTINNPEEDVTPVEEQLEADPNTVEGAFPASLNRPRAEAIGFAANATRRAKALWKLVRRSFDTKYQASEDYAQALAASYGLIRLPDNLDVARKFEMLESRKIGGQMRLNRWFLKPIEDKIKELGLDPNDVGMYLWARSAFARNALVLERSGEINGSGLTDAEAQAQLDKLELEGLGPALREVAKMHDALVDYIGHERVKGGLLSRADWKAMRKAQPFYTPLKGYALNGDMQVAGDPNPHSDEERGIARSNGTRIREVLTAQGRESMPFNPLFNLISDAEFAIARIEQNKVKEAFLNNVLSDPKSHEGLVTVYTPEKKVHASGLTTRPKMGKEGPVDMNALAAQKNPTLMIVKKDGESYYIEFTETPAGNALYRAFANMTPRELGWFMRGHTFHVDGKSYHIPGYIEVANTLKSFKTRFSPVFTFGVSWLRDFTEAYMSARAAQGIKGGPAEGTKLARKTARYIASVRGVRTISDYLKGKDPTTAEGELMTLLFEQFLEDGGAVGRTQVLEAERYAAEAVKRIRRYAAAKRGDPRAAALMAKDMMAGAMDYASQLFDLHARFATYRAAIEENISREDAAKLALDSTLDMTRRGELAPYADSHAFFFSPTVQGTRKLFLQGRYSAIARKLFTKLVGGGMLLYLFNRFGPGAGDDDEDGRPNILEVNNATAASRAIFRYGPGMDEYVTVPMAFGMGIFNYIGGQLMAMSLGDIPPEEAGVNIVSGLWNFATPIKTEGTEGLSGPISFIVPDVGFQTIYDLYENRNAFGSQIYTERNKYDTTPESELGREDTGEVWKFIARGMNSLFGGTSTVDSAGDAQPEKYRYIVQQLLGGAYGSGRDIVSLATDEAKPDQMLVNRIPIIKSFFGSGGKYVPMNKFYEDYDQLNALYAVYNDEEPDSEKQAENEAKFPMQTDPEVMDAFGDALSELRKINKDNRDGDYASREAVLEAKNEVYENFNRVYAKAKREE